jgi:maltose-binding protein MalE
MSSDRCTALSCTIVSFLPGRKINRRAALRCAAGAAAGVLLAGCAQLSPAATPVATAPAVLPEPATLLLWHGWSGVERQLLGTLVDSYNRQHSSGRILLQSVPLASFASELRAAVAAGSGPHLVLMPNTWLGGLAADGTLLLFDDSELAEERGWLLPSVVAGALARDRDGARRLAGLPIRYDTLSLYYNSANVLTAPADTASLLDSARGLGAPTADPPVWGLALNLSLDNTIGYLYAFGGRVFDADGQLVLAADGRAGTERWLAWLQALNADTRIFARAESSIAVDQELKRGHALMTFDWAHQIAIYRALWADKFGVAALPLLSETGQRPQPYVRSDLLAVNGRVSASERAAAMAFARSMVAEDVQQALLRSDMQPARTVKIEGDDAIAVAARALRAQAEVGVPMPNSSERAVVDQELRVMLQQVLMNLATPADAVTDAERRLRERLGVTPTRTS